ncbi:MAG: LapA family protein [Thermodesulfobacteriota bacterium]
MRFLRIILVVIFIILICVLYIENQEIVNHVFKFKLNLLFTEYGPVGVYNVGIITIAFVIGVLLSVIFGVFSSAGKSSELKIKNKTIKDLENEIIHLENKVRDFENKSSATKNSSEKSTFSIPG